jgi:LacI family transcriptional regulator
MSATIRDVAEAAGVSAMAVSKVLHGTGSTVRVSADTAANIRRVAAELRYQPNRLARSFRQQKTNTIGLVFSHFGRIGEADGYFAALLNGAMTATFQSEYSLTICPKLAMSSTNGQLNDGRFDGLLWCKPDYTKESAESIGLSKMPIVMMHAPAGEGPEVPRFCCDNELGLKLAVDHLVQLGHRSIGFLYDHFNHTTAEGRVRTAAFHAAKAEHGLPSSDEDLLFWSQECDELVDFLANPKRPTAIIVFSELHAVYVLRKAEQLGISVPGDLSVIGFDSTAFCESTRPRLTAISQPIEQMAYDATTKLISYIEAEQAGSKSFIYPCGLDVRESTGRPSLPEHA